MRHVACERHRALLAIDGKHRAHHAVFRPLRIADLEREEKGGARQAFGVFAEITLIKIERGFAVEFEKDVALGLGDTPSRSEYVPTAGAAVAEADARTIKADGRDAALTRRVVGADQRFNECRAVAGKTAGDRNIGADRTGDARNQRAAVDLEAVGKNEDAGQVVGGQ